MGGLETRVHRDRPRLRLGVRSLVALAMVVAARPLVARAQKSDVVVLNNGDRITGEIKGLSRGKLDYSTDDAGRLSIKWEKIARVTSQFFFEVELSSGRKFFGRLAEPAEDGRVVVQLTRPDTIPLHDVVSIVRIDARFITRLKAYLDVGFTLAKANLATTFTTSGEVAYRGQTMGGKVAFSSYAQGQRDVPTTTRNSFNLSVQRYLPRRWAAGGLLGLDQNDELSLDLRVTVGAAAGRTQVQTNSADLGFIAGAVVVQESFSRRDSAGGPADTVKTSVEGLIGANWTAFRLDSPKLDFSTELRVYPGITTLGRVRGDLDVRIRYELLKDFFVGLNLSDQFDSRPPGGSGAKNDFVTSVSIGWSYRR